MEPPRNQCFECPGRFMIDVRPRLRDRHRAYWAYDRGVGREVRIPESLDLLPNRRATRAQCGCFCISRVQGVAPRKVANGLLRSDPAGKEPSGSPLVPEVLNANLAEPRADNDFSVWVLVQQGNN